MVIVGLGNPGERYRHTLHNVGFKVVDEIAYRRSWSWKHVGQFKAEIAKGSLGERNYHLLKPTTYMNLSGEAVRSYLDYHQLGIEQLIVVVDDADLPPGELRLRPFGGTGGHNGLKSVVHELHTNEFKRLKIGIGRSTLVEMSLADYVLAPQSQEVWAPLSTSIERAKNLLEQLASETFDAVMNTANKPLAN